MSDEQVFVTILAAGLVLAVVGGGERREEPDLPAPVSPTLGGKKEAIAFCEEIFAPTGASTSMMKPFRDFAPCMID